MKREPDDRPRCCGCGHPGEHDFFDIPGMSRRARTCKPCQKAMSAPHKPWIKCDTPLRLKAGARA